MKRGIAFFDFDGTITTRDTMLDFIRYLRGSTAFLTGMAAQFPWLIGYRLKLISNQAAKERALAHFFGGMPVGEFRAAAARYATEKIPALIRQSALGEIKKLQSEGFDTVIVSASAQDWLTGWTKQQGCALIASALQVKDGKITGRLAGINCHGQEKVRRILGAYDLTTYDRIYAFGDTPGDKPMLALAPGHAHYKPFR